MQIELGLFVVLAQAVHEVEARSHALGHGTWLKTE
jgi:hypothetical protein